MSLFANINGVLCPPGEAKVSVFDRGFLFGDGVYETGRTVDRCPMYWAEHLERLRRSAGKLLIPIAWSDEELSRRLFETLRAFGKDNAYFRVIVSRGQIAHIGLDAQTVGDPTLVYLLQDLPGNLEEKWREGVHVATSKILRNSPDAQDPNIKTSNYLNSLLALQDVQSRGAEDAILCDACGRVTEGTTFSIFGVTGEGRLITPSLEVGILDSITRRHVIEIARAFHSVEEGFFSLDQMQSCAEVFIASSVREIVPIRQWDEKRFSVPSPATARLQKALKEEIQRHALANAHF